MNVQSSLSILIALSFHSFLTTCTSAAGYQHHHDTFYFCGDYLIPPSLPSRMSNSISLLTYSLICGLFFNKPAAPFILLVVQWLWNLCNILISATLWVCICCWVQKSWIINHIRYCKVQQDQDFYWECGWGCNRFRKEDTRCCFVLPHSVSHRKQWRYLILFWLKQHVRSFVVLKYVRQ